MPVILEHNNTSRVINLEGSVNIACAAELKSLLMEALSERQPLIVHLEEATDLDVCIVQLLVAALRESKQVGMNCTLAGPLKEEISEAMMYAGFEAFPITLDAVLLSEV
jgi:anti-anti-sigma regulatory factor